MSTYSDYQYPHREQHAQKVDEHTPRAAPSKLTEEQLLLLQQQWSQKTARLRSDQRSMRSARSSVSGVQYNRMNIRPVSSSCAGRAPTSFFDPPGSTTPTPTPTPSPFPTDNTSAFRDRSFPGFAVAPVSGSGYHPSGYTTPDLQQQQQQQALLQPRLVVRRRTDADVGTGGTEQEEDISPVGRLRHRHTGAGALPGRFGTFGGSPFAAATIDDSTSSNYSSYAPYTPPNPAANARIARTFSLPGRCSTPSSTASLAGLQYACSGNRIGGNFGAFLHGQGSSSSSSRIPGTPNSWTGQIATPAHSGLQAAFSVASTGSTGLQPAYSTVSNSSAGFRCNPVYTAISAGVPSAAQAGFAIRSSSVSVSTGIWTPASRAASGVQTPFTAISASGPKSRRGSSAGLPPVAPTASGAYSTYSASGSTAAAAAATEHQPVTAGCQEDLRSVYSRVSSSGSLTGVPVSTHRYSTAGSLCGEERGYMASVPEIPYTYPSAAATAAGPMASAAAAAAAAGISNSFAEHALYPGSFLPPLETVLTGQSELAEDVGSPRIPPGCIVSIFRALGIRRAPVKPRSPRRKTNGHKSRHSRQTNSHLGRVVDNCQHQDDVSNRTVMTLSLTSRQGSLADGGGAAAAAEPVIFRQPVVSRQNSAEPVCLQQPPPQQQQQQQDEQKEHELGYPLAAAGPAAVAAAGVCEPAAAGSGAVMATTVLYNSSPRGIYRYSSPNAGNSHTYVPGYSHSVGGGVPYAPPRISSSNGRRLSNPAVAATAAASSRAVTAAGAAGAAAAAAIVARTSSAGLKPLNRVHSIAKDLDPYAPKGFAASDIGSAGYSNSSRIYGTPSTPGTARSYVSSSGSTAAAFGGAAFAAAAAAPRGASVGGCSMHTFPPPLYASGNAVSGNESASRRISRSSNAGSIGGGSSGGSFRPTTYPLQHQQLQYPSASRSHRCSNAGSVISTVSEQQQQQQQVPSGYPPRSRRCSNAGSVMSTMSERLDRTYAEVVSSPRGSHAGSVSGSTGRVGQKVPVAYRASEPRQLQAVTGRGQLAWQPRQPGTTGYLSTQ